MKKITIYFLGYLLLPCSLFAQTNFPEWNAAKIKLQLEKLNTLGSVLYVAAHPDDENTQLLAYLVNQKKYRTAYLALTRGDGGQNLVGEEQGSDLGLIRTQELLAARRIDGAEQFFSRANDFGYSKTAKETFKIWGHNRILADVVWRVRKFRPDIIICRFPEDKRAGHGHHWASAVLAHEAFRDAADSTKFPEQLRYVKTWQAKRILWNTYHFGNTNTTSPNQFKIDAGRYNPLLGKGYGEIAAASRSMHKSQGFGVSASYGHDWEHFKTIAGSTPKQSLMDEVNTTWTRVKGGAAVESLVKKALQQYDMDHPGEIVPMLLKIKKAISHISNDYWRNLKEKQVTSLILACSGIWTDAYSNGQYVVPGQNMTVHTQVINRSKNQVVLNNISLLSKNAGTDNPLQEGQLKKEDYTVKVPEKDSISQPYWLLEKHPIGYYHIPRQQLVGLPENPPQLKAHFNFTIDQDTISYTLPIAYRFTDPVRGEVHDPLVIAPPVTANIDHKVYVFTKLRPQVVTVQLKSFKDNTKGTATLKVPNNFEVENNNQKFSFQEKGEERLLHFKIMPTGNIDQSLSQTLSVHLNVNGKQYHRGIKVIAHNYIPIITVFPLSESKLVRVPLKLSNGLDENKHPLIGYIMGAGDQMPQALRQVGYKVQLLNDKDLSSADLQHFDAIIVGIRAYNTREQLKYAQNRLLQYVKNGGTMVVQYNKPRGLKVPATQIGPYPFEITKNRVTDENAKVTFKLPKGPVLNVPNKITENDFVNWIQERGLYFVSNTDAHYRKPLSMQDAGEEPLNGSLIVCDYGKGKYVYTTLDFFRDLPAGIPGAIRLFANLIAGR